LKLVATDTEKALIDFDAEDLTDDDMVVGNDRIEHTMKLKRGLISETSEGLDLEALEDVIQDVPLEQFHPDVIEVFIDKLIASADTKYTESHRQMLEKTLKGGSGTVAEYVPDLPTGLQTLNDRIDAEETAEAPPTPADTANAQQPAKETSPPDSDRGETAAVAGAQENDSVAGGNQQDGPSEAVVQSITQRLPDMGVTTNEITEPISRTKRESCHLVVLDRLSNEELSVLAPIYGVDEQRNPEEIQATIAGMHANKEIENGGQTANIEPVKWVREAVSDPDGDVSTWSRPAEIQQLDIQFSVDEAIPIDTRIKAHRKALEELPDAYLDSLLHAEFDWWSGDTPTDSDVMKLAEAYADREIESSGDTADVAPGDIIKQRFPPTTLQPPR